MYCSPRSAAKHYNVNEITLRRWAAAGKIEHKRTEGGHHRYLLKARDEQTNRRKVIYARVSSSKQQQDLDRQIRFMRRRFPEYEVVRDIGGGANFNRKGLQTLLEWICRGEIESIAVYSKDRLTRFGGELIEFICNLFDTTIVYVEKNEKGENETDELSRDLLTIITHFTAK